MGLGSGRRLCTLCCGWALNVVHVQLVHVHFSLLSHRLTHSKEFLGLGRSQTDSGQESCQSYAALPYTQYGLLEIGYKQGGAVTLYSCDYVILLLGAEN